MIKIAYFIDRIIAGGTELQLLEQINRLERTGAKQILFCLYKSQEHERLAPRCRTEILDIFSLAKLSTLRKLKYVVDLLEQEDVDIIQTYFFDSTLFGVLCGKIAGVKRVISCRRDLGFWYTKKLLFFLKLANMLTDRILVNSLAVRANVHTMERVPPSKIDVINNGIDLARYKSEELPRTKSRHALSVRDDEVCIGIVANMSRKVKRVDLFIEAARMVLSRARQARFFIVGDGRLRNSLQQLKEKHGLGDSVLFLGKDFDTRFFLSALDIGVITSDSEGLSNSVMEYMASGIPTVASDVGGNRELIRHNQNGCLFRRGDPEDLAEKISDLIINTEKRRAYGRQAASDIRSYDWPARIHEMLDYYRRQLNHGGQGK